MSAHVHVSEKYFLPSEVARLVLGYLQEEKCPKSYTCFLKESKNLNEYGSYLNRGLQFPTHIMGMTLTMMLEEFAQLKTQVLHTEKSMALAPLWNQLDSVVSNLKIQTRPRQMRFAEYANQRSRTVMLKRLGTKKAHRSSSGSERSAIYSNHAAQPGEEGSSEDQLPDVGFPQSPIMNERDSPVADGRTGLQSSDVVNKMGLPTISSRRTGNEAPVSNTAIIVTHPGGNVSTSQLCLNLVGVGPPSASSTPVAVPSRIFIGAKPSSVIIHNPGPQGTWSNNIASGKTGASETVGGQDDLPALKKLLPRLTTEDLSGKVVSCMTSKASADSSNFKTSTCQSSSADSDKSIYTTATCHESDLAVTSVVHPSTLEMPERENVSTAPIIVSNQESVIPGEKSAAINKPEIAAPDSRRTWNIAGGQLAHHRKVSAKKCLHQPSPNRSTPTSCIVHTDDEEESSNSLQQLQMDVYKIVSSPQKVSVAHDTVESPRSNRQTPAKPASQEEKRTVLESRELNQTSSNATTGDKEAVFDVVSMTVSSDAEEQSTNVPDQDLSLEPKSKEETSSISGLQNTSGRSPKRKK